MFDADVTVTGAQPGVAHSFGITSTDANGQPTLHPVCTFTADAKGAGSCKGTVHVASDSRLAEATAMAFDPRSNGYRTVADGPFVPR